MDIVKRRGAKGRVQQTDGLQTGLQPCHGILCRQKIGVQNGWSRAERHVLATRSPCLFYSECFLEGIDEDELLKCYKVPASNGMLVPARSFRLARVNYDDFLRGRCNTVRKLTGAITKYKVRSLAVLARGQLVPFGSSNEDNLAFP